MLIIQSSFIDIKLPRKLDVIFSNSALHWIQDHRKAFQNFWEMLKPIDDGNDTDIMVGSNSNDTTTGGGQLLIQCGGYGICLILVMSPFTYGNPTLLPYYVQVSSDISAELEWFVIFCS
jgi:SAM-dependent methyltransferase